MGFPENEAVETVGLIDTQPSQDKFPKTLRSRFFELANLLKLIVSEEMKILLLGEMVETSNCAFRIRHIKTGKLAAR